MIETPLAMLPLDRSSQEICDWFELYALSSEYHSANFAELARMWDKRRNSEDVDFEGSASTQEDFFLEEIYQTIRERMEFLKDCYPFRFSENDEELIYDKDDLNNGSVIYLFCLFLSNTNNDDIFDDASFFEINNKVRDLFQACATWAAAGEVEGHAYSFGFPRPDHSGFLVKLTAIYQHFSDGKVRNTPLPGSSVSPKDEEIDIIAWRPRQDNAAGTYYLLGQVASGHNWPDKSIMGTIDAFHETWFEIQPASKSISAMFIPFNIIPNRAETREDKISILTRKFGSIFYRYRIPFFAKRGLEISKTDRGLTIERTAEIDNIFGWVRGVIEKFRKACVYS
ncbi:hypothetical protein [Nitrosomonas sp.]|uniref:hypothetical protein n=1 Tax=Nitrosomonas sp. TaxID=42353 RepID=UPI0025DEFB86|nr:hypothetical protein [Nitrosomonas sp.]